MGPYSAAHPQYLFQPEYPLPPGISMLPWLKIECSMPYEHRFSDRFLTSYAGIIIGKRDITNCSFKHHLLHSRKDKDQTE